MTSKLTASQASKLLRDVIKDYNFWGQSESDAPLSIKTSKTPLDDKKILSLDASARKRLGEITIQPVPGKITIQPVLERQIIKKDLEATLKELVMNVLSDIESKSKGDLAELALPAQCLEYYTQLSLIFRQLSDVKMILVDAPNDPNVSLFIIGMASDGIVYAQSLLVQSTKSLSSNLI
jgi:hypothetical protein